MSWIAYLAYVLPFQSPPSDKMRLAIPKTNIRIALAPFRQLFASSRPTANLEAKPILNTMLGLALVRNLSLPLFFLFHSYTYFILAI